MYHQSLQAHVKPLQQQDNLNIRTSISHSVCRLRRGDSSFITSPTPDTPNLALMSSLRPETPNDVPDKRSRSPPSFKICDQFLHLMAKDDSDRHLAAVEKLQEKRKITMAGKLLMTEVQFTSLASAS